MEDKNLSNFGMTNGRKNGVDLHLLAMNAKKRDPGSAKKWFIFIGCWAGNRNFSERSFARVKGQGGKTRRMILRSGRFSARKTSTRPIDR